MNPSFIICRKRDGMELMPGEIAYFVQGFASGEIPDYQMSALAMAIYLQGMTTTETAILTEEMLRSGEQLTWPANHVPIVDKHSTGGIGDKVSVPLAPLLACSGLQVPMISGRGLGATGGTLDKLESIPGFRTNLSNDEMRTVVNKVGCVITGASSTLAPADKKLYALRDVTGTVPSIPLITASIMSKKLAEGLDALVLDVKFGSGAFMKTLEQARALANSLVQVGQRMGVATTALLTDMNQPLGRMVGNTVEIDESVAMLQGTAPRDLVEITLALGGHLLQLTGLAIDAESGAKQLEQHIQTGAALEKLKIMVAAQGGDLDAMRPVARQSIVVSERDGVVGRVDAEAIGRAVITLGGGRKVMSDAIDHSVGLEMLVRVGDRVTADTPLLRLFAPDHLRREVSHALRKSITLTDADTPPLPLLVEQIG